MEFFPPVSIPTPMGHSYRKDKTFYKKLTNLFGPLKYKALKQIPT